ncbi:MAG: hypothetical protein DMG04_26495 [Acidobacteria bacterium]|nr:MAG: hypothetical protein DMG04_26495 [Acidobacteriota bacterium]
MVRVNSSSVTDESSVRIPVDVRRFPWIRRLAADYAYDFGAVAPFFSGDPSDRTAWADAIARSQAYERRRADIAAVIAGQQQRRNAPPRAREAGRLLADSRTVAIVTGQQAGLFGGPLFTLLKALTALKLANQVSRDHSVPVVAIFWIDAEDHDWEEIRSCTVFDADLTSRTVSLPPRPGAEPAPVATIKLDDAVVGVLDETERVLPPTAFREDLLAELRRSYAPGTGMADAFGQWLEQVLGGRGLVVYDSSDARSKPLVSSVFARELSMPGQTVKLASLAGSDLIARGYHAQVHPQDDHDFPDDLLRRRPERARVSGAAARCVSALRRADAADVSARLGDAARFGGGTFSHQVQAAARGAAGAGRSGVERAAAGADSAGRRRIVHRRVADDRTTDDASRRSDPRPRSDARRRRAIDARPHAARSPDAARQDDPGGQAPRRDAAAPVHSRPRAGLPRWPRAGAHDRLRVLPQSVRARARRTAGRGAPPRPGTALDCHDIEQGFNASFFSSGFSGGSAGCGTPRSPLRFRSSFCGSSPATTTSASRV